MESILLAIWIAGIVAVVTMGVHRRILREMELLEFVPLTLLWPIVLFAFGMIWILFRGAQARWDNYFARRGRQWW